MGYGATDSSSFDRGKALLIDLLDDSRGKDSITILLSSDPNHPLVDQVHPDQIKDLSQLLEQTQYLCSHHKLIYLSTGEKEDRWSIHTRK